MAQPKSVSHPWGTAYGMRGWLVRSLPDFPILVRAYARREAYGAFAGDREAKKRCKRVKAISTALCVQMNLEPDVYESTVTHYARNVVEARSLNAAIEYDLVQTRREFERLREANPSADALIAAVNAYIAALPWPKVPKSETIPTADDIWNRLLANIKREAQAAQSCPT